MTTDLIMAHRRADCLLQRLIRLRFALEEYANPDNWDDYETRFTHTEIMAWSPLDERTNMNPSLIARSALEADTAQNIMDAS